MSEDLTVEDMAYARSMKNEPIRDIAESYIAPLLAEGILKVHKDHIQIMDLVIPRERVVYLHIILTALRAGAPLAQSPRGYTVTPVTLINGNDAQPGYKIVSNVPEEGEILLTRKLATELWEVTGFFIPKINSNALVPNNNEGVE